MNKKLNFSEKLDFEDIDLTAPDIVVNDIAQQISAETKNIICGKIIPYEGDIFSHTESVFAGLYDALAQREIDIQSTLGKQGLQSKQFEFYLSTPSFQQYKYRICYMKYGVSNYPVTVVLDQDILPDITPDDSNYTLSCSNRSDLETLFYKIIYSRHMTKIMQELIRINQVQKELPQQIEFETGTEELIKPDIEAK